MDLIHLFCSSVFVGFILFDRVYIRRKFEPTKANQIYKSAKIPLIFIADLIIISGSMLYQNQTIKLALGVATIVLFFACPFVSSRISPKSRRFYRLLVLVLAITTAFVGLAK